MTVHRTVNYYQDTGCSLAPSCLNCPFPSCREDDALAFQAARRKEKDRQVEARCMELGPGFFVPRNVAAIVAEEFGLTERTVYRIMGRV